MYNRLRPLHYVNPNGPNIESCIGIIKGKYASFFFLNLLLYCFFIIESSVNQNADKLKEIYEYKLKLLEEKDLLSSSQLDDYQQKRLKDLGLWDGKVEDDPYSLVSRKR